MDLHDGVLQSLYAVSLELASLMRELGAAGGSPAACTAPGRPSADHLPPATGPGSPKAVRGALRRTSVHVGQVIDELRGYIEALRNPQAGWQQLRDRLAAVASLLRSRHRSRVHLVWRVDREESSPLAVPPAGGDVVPPLAVDHLVYIAREAASNAIRHGGARTVTIEAQAGVALRGDQPYGAFTLAIHDDGRGFRVAAPGSARSGAGRGLENIAARARLLGARVDVRSARSRGAVVRVELSWPLRPGPGAAALGDTQAT